mmetsp:Transcript_34330/g.34998  ORF Transcript_34330/g.34998 Transcript_34330/m.34998 type:complete len:104 (+) Transcript_34330:220-531(+)
MSISKLKQFSPEFRTLIREAGRKCFGNLPIVNHRTGFKLLKRNPIGPLIVNHYLPDLESDFRAVAPDFQTDVEERREEKLIRLRRRGKGPPKKGEGKRAGRRK